MALSRLDDYLGHQTTDTMDRVFTSDRHFYDRYYFNMHSSSDEFFMVMGLGQYPNLGTTDCFVDISIGDTLYCVRASRELGADRMDTAIGPFNFEVIEPMKKLRVTLVPNEHDIEMDLTFDGAVPPLEEEKFFRRAEHGRVTTEGSRYSQVGNYSGTLKVAGRTIKVTPDTFKGARDHSWGIRGVGDPEPPGISMKYMAGADFGLFHNWVPVQFKDYMIKMYVDEDANGVRDHDEAMKVWNYGSGKEDEWLGTPTLEVDYISGTREIKEARTTFDKGDGSKPLVMTHTPLRTVYLQFGSGYSRDPEWMHGQWHGPETKVEGLSTSVATQADRDKWAGLNETLCRFELSTGEVGYGMHENIVSGSYRPFGFNSPTDVAP